ncbi:unnamed protein product [Clavelina lepadiformis]|uniref:Elongator complex protein 6 n=1 Tax=Clavelina lepadiformis TaxID=159417 RepID=A0ABP0FCU3_CLALP
MFEELNNIAGWSLKNLPTNKMILISDWNTDASFLLHHFLAFYLKANSKVVLAHAAQSFIHYNLACSRLGVNLERSRNNGDLIALNLLDASLQQYVEGSCENLSLDSEYCLNFLFGDNSLKHLFKVFKRCVENTKDALIILDDVTLFLGLGVSQKDLNYFVHYMDVLCKSNNCTFVTLFHQNFAPDISEPSPYLCCQLYASYEIEVKGLESGYSKDVHGVLTLKSKETKGIKTYQPHKLMHYRLTDRSLQLLAPGTSSAVL